MSVQKFKIPLITEVAIADGENKWYKSPRTIIQMLEGGEELNIEMYDMFGKLTSTFSSMLWIGFYQIGDNVYSLKFDKNSPDIVVEKLILGD